MKKFDSPLLVIPAEAGTQTLGLAEPGLPSASMDPRLREDDDGVKVTAG